MAIMLPSEEDVMGIPLNALLVCQGQAEKYGGKHSVTAKSWFCDYYRFKKS